MEEQLEEHLQDVRRTLKGRSSISYVSLNKDSHVLEVPEVTIFAEGVAGVTIQASSCWCQSTCFKRYGEYPFRLFCILNAGACERRAW